MSPADFENRSLVLYGILLKKLERWFATTWRLNVLALFILSLCFALLFFWRAHLAADNPFGFSLIGTKSSLVLSLIALGLFRPLLTERGFLILGWLTAAAAILLFPPEASTPRSLVTSFLVTFGPGLTLIWISMRTEIGPFGLFGFALCTMMAMAATASLAHVTFRPERYFMVTSMVIAWSQTLPTGQRHLVNRNSFMSPVFSLYALPLFPNEWQFRPEPGIRISGLLMIIGAMTAFATATYFHPLMTEWREETTAFAQLVCGGLTFIYFYLNSWGALNLVVGIVRWWGWDVSSPFHFALLATSPQECWRRWNIPFYRWFRNMIFLPVLRHTGSLWLGVATVFALTFILHDGFDMAQFLSAADNQSHFSALRQKAFFFGGHGLAVAIGLSFPKLWPNEKKTSAWIGVVFTWMIMAGIHWWVRYY